MFRLILFVLIVLFALFLVAVRYLPWWGIVLLVVGILLLVRFGLKYAVVAIFTIPFKAKGAVLKNAEVEVHSIAWEPAPEKPARAESPTPAHAALEYDGPDESGNGDALGEAEEPPDEDIDDELPDEDEGPRDHYRIDLTISPRPKAGGFQLWEPYELRLVPFALRSGANLKNLDDEAGEPVQVEIFRDGQFGPDEEGKYFGPLRLRMLVASSLDAPRHVKFRYYFEMFGDLTLPPSGGGA